jgi:hypothetical protein
MHEHHGSNGNARDAVPSRRRWWIGFAVFAVLAIVLLWEEHQAHLLGALPWLILIACPLLHLFMHGGHGHGGKGGHGGDNQ